MKQHYRYAVHSHSTSSQTCTYYGTERGLLLKCRRFIVGHGINGYYAIIANEYGRRANYYYEQPINKPLEWE
jgi:hypothetical protein